MRSVLSAVIVALAFFTSACGYLGQYLMVVPAARLVAVRQIRHDSHRGEDDSFEEFRFMVLKLIRNEAGPGAATLSKGKETER